MRRHEPRQKLALEFGATDIVTERGEEGVARIKDMTGGYGAHSVIEAVGTQESIRPWTNDASSRPCCAPDATGTSTGSTTESAVSC